MSLPSGAKLGPYEVMAPLGAGGMGEVYRARDTRLDRTVAIKVLPEHLAQSPDLQQRFEREARAVSAINHPHICALYDIGHQDGTDYLVLEYLEGESLHDRLAKDPLPLDQALRRATEIADALDKAHRSGVVHRDLKPGNVILTKAGAKLLDFGLAKRAEPVVKGDERLSALATRAPLTEKGTLVGTIPYMAPEQIEGREADARTDIWAFGALLYEMVTGKRAFVGTSPASLIGAILKDEPPPIRELKPLTPPSLERLVKTCLAKDPDERWQNAHDLVAELRWIADEGTRASATAAEPSGKGPVARAVPWLVTLATVAVAAWALWTRSARGTADLPVQQLEVGFPADIEPRPDVAGGGLDLSPDGRLVAMTGVKRARRMAFVRRLDSTEVLEVSSEGGVNGVVFSPEGRRIAILGGNGRITSLSLVDRQRTELVSGADVTGSLGWGEAGVVFARNGALWMAPAGGGEPRALTALDASRHEVMHTRPMLLPGERTVLFSSLTTEPGTERIEAISIAGGPRTVVVDRATTPVWSPSGHLLFARDGAVLATAFDAGAVRAQGPAIPVLPGGLVGTSQSGMLTLRLGGNGTLLLAPQDFGGERLVSVSRDGSALTLGLPRGLYVTRAYRRTGGA
jgi:eukaryotic-like serine/threonine-protein kinase